MINVEPVARCSRASLAVGMFVQFLCIGGAAHVLLASESARAQAAPPAGHEEEAFDFMNLSSQHGLHNLDDESWNVYGQFTYISSWKLPFQAPYTNANRSINSLVPGHDRRFTGTFTLFFWPNLC